MKNNFKYPILYTFRRCPYAMRARFAIRSSKIMVEVREIKLINSEFGSSTGFAQGALTCGSLAAVLISLSYAAFFDSSGRDKSKLSSSFLEEEDLKEVFKYILPVAFVGGVMNVVRLSTKAVEATYKIDQDNWKIIAS